MKQIKKITLIIFSITIMANTTFAQESKGLEIANTADLKDTGWKTASITLSMILKNKNGQETTRNMHSKLFEMTNDGDKTLMIFDSPKDVKGTASLIFSHKSGADDQWLYLPALKRIKRISSNNKSGPFMGSEFANEDLSSQEVEKYIYKFIKEESINGNLCSLVERYPKAKNSGYMRQQVWFNKINYRIEKIDYYDRKNSLLKTLTYTDYKLYKGKYWRSLNMEMINHQNGKQTTLKFSNYVFGVDLKEDDFTSNRLKRVR